MNEVQTLDSHALCVFVGARVRLCKKKAMQVGTLCPPAPAGSQRAASTKILLSRVLLVIICAVGCEAKMLIPAPAGSCEHGVQPPQTLGCGGPPAELRCARWPAASVVVVRAAVMIDSCTILGVGAFVVVVGWLVG